MAGTKLFADRGFVIINGVEAAHCKNVRVSLDQSLSVVNTMTRNRRSAGFKKGNLAVSGSMEFDIEADKAQIDLAFKYGNEVNVVIEVGGERKQIVGLEQASEEMNASVGDSSKSISFVALDCVNENGPAVNADIGL